MQIIIRKNSIEKKDLIYKAIEEAKRFFEEQNIELPEIKYYIVFSKYFRTSRFFPNTNSKYQTPVICIEVSNEIRLYKLKQLKIKRQFYKTKKLLISIVMNLIHELTHLIDYTRGLDITEYRATKNELLYLRKKDYNIYQKLVETKGFQNAKNKKTIIRNK